MGFRYNLQVRNTHTHTCTHMHTLAHTCTHIHRWIFWHTNYATPSQGTSSSYTNAYFHTHTHTHTYTHTQMDLLAHELSDPVEWNIKLIHKCIFSYIYTYTRIHIHRWIS